jgi:hypothetical protein
MIRILRFIGIAVVLMILFAVPLLGLASTLSGLSSTIHTLGQIGLDGLLTFVGLSFLMLVIVSLLRLVRE